MKMNTETIDLKDELCGIEFYSAEDLESFQQLNPRFRRTMTLQAGQHWILVFHCSGFPTRETAELFTTEGRLYATLSGRMHWSTPTRSNLANRANPAVIGRTRSDETPKQMSTKALTPEQIADRFYAKECASLGFHEARKKVPATEETLF